MVKGNDIEIPETLMIWAHGRGSWTRGRTLPDQPGQAGHAKPRAGITDTDWKTGERRGSDACDRNSAGMEKGEGAGRGDGSWRARE